MMLPATSPHALPPPSSCHSSPGNSRADDHDDDEFHSGPALHHHRLSMHREVVVPVRRVASVQGQGADGPQRSWRELLRSKQRSSLVRKVTGLLHDNRALSSRNPDTARRLRQLNAEVRADTNCRALKFILNALLIGIGLLLLLSVLAAIAYTSTGQCMPLTILCSLPAALHYVRVRVAASNAAASVCSTAAPSLEPRFLQSM